MKNRVAFITNKLIDYRIKLFYLLSNNLCMDFYFDHMDQLELKENYYLLKNINIGKYNLSYTLFIRLVQKRYCTIIVGDLFNVNSIIGFIYAKIFNKNLIVWEERWFYSRALKHKFLWPFFLYMWQNSDYIIVPGTYSSLFFSSFLKTQNIVIAPNASILESLTNIPLIPNTILYLGRIIERKKIHILILAFKELQQEFQNMKLIICGKINPLYFNTLKKIIYRYDIKNIEFKGYVTKSEKVKYIGQSDIVVYPVVNEVWGLVVNEAMSLGKPVISTYSCAAAYDLIIDGFNGFLVFCNDYINLYNKLRIFFNLTYDERQKMGNNAKNTVIKKHTYENMAKVFLQVIKDI